MKTIYVVVQQSPHHEYSTIPVAAFTDKETAEYAAKGTVVRGVPAAVYEVELDHPKDDLFKEWDDAIIKRYEEI